MAPETTPQTEIQTDLKQIVEGLYRIISQIANHEGDRTNTALERELPAIISRLSGILRNTPHLTVQIPPDVIEYVQEGRNPDIYTREFVELAMRHNQRLRGKMDAYAAFRDVFAREIVGAVPVLRREVEGVLVHTGGDVQVLRDGRVKIEAEEG